MKSHQELTAERLRELFSYDPEDGLFRRKVSTNSRSRVGEVAGCLSRYGYRLISVDSRDYMAHRLVWLYVHGVWPKHQLDHANGVRDDNRIANLREATNGENQQNCAMNCNNTSGHPGVSRDKRKGKWQAYIRTQGKQRNLGYFDQIEDAIAARRKAKSELHTFHPRDNVQQLRA